MAEEEKLILGVEFGGAPGVNQFLAAMGVLPSRLDTLFDEMDKAAPGSTNTWQTKGAQLARAYYAGVQAELAGFKGVGGANLIDQVMGSAGLTKSQMREMRGVLQDFDRLQRQNRTGAFASKDFDQASVLGLTGAKRNVDQVRTATTALNQQLETTTRRFDALKAASATGIREVLRTQERGAQRVLGPDGYGGVQYTSAVVRQAERMGLPLGQAPQQGVGADAQRNAAALLDQQIKQQTGLVQQQLRSMREQARVLERAPLLQDRPEPIQRVMAPVVQATQGPAAPPPSERQRQIAQLRAEGVNGRTLTAQGFTRGEVSRVDAQYGPLIEAIRAEAAARRFAAYQAGSAVRMRSLENADLAAGRTTGLSAQGVVASRSTAAATAARQADFEAYRRESDRRILQQERGDLAAVRQPLLAQRQVQVQQAAAAAAAPPPREGFFQQFRTGFQGPQTSSTAEMLGQTARVSLFYGAAYRGLSLVQDALTNITQETLQYEGALTDLAVATNRSRSENADLATDLGNQAAAAGYASSLGVQGGAKAIGLFSAAELPQAEQERIATTSFAVASRVARVAGSNDPVAVQTQLVGAARSFGYGVDRLTDIEDAVTYISRNTGQDPTNLLGATSNIATLGRASGFDPNTLAAIVAQVGTTTGQNPEATAGQFRQVLSRDFESVASRAREIFGIDTSQMTTVADVIEAVSAAPRTQEQTNEFASVFGKGGSQTVALITLENYGRIQSLASGATNAQGVGEDTFNTVMRDIGQQLRVFGADASNLGLKLVETGVLDWLLLVVQGADGLVTALSGVLELFNEIPRPLRSVGFAIAEIALAARLLQAANLARGSRALPTVTSRAVNGGTAAIAAAQSAAAAGRASAVAAGRSGALGAAGGALGFLRGQGQLTMSAADRAALQNNRYVQPRTGAAGALDRARIGTGLTGVGLGVAAAGLAIATQQAIESYERITEAGELLDAALRNSAAAVTEAQYLDAAAQAGAAASEIEAGQYQNLKVGDFAGVIPGIISSLTTGDESARLRELEQQNIESAARAAERQQAAEQARPSAIFTDFSETGINDTITELTNRGYTAAESLALLNEALFTFSEGAVRAGGEAPGAVVARNQFDTLAGDLGASAVKGLTSTAEWQSLGANAIGQNNILADPLANVFNTNGDKRRMEGAANILGNADTQAAVQSAVRDSVLGQLEGMTEGDVALLSDGDLDQITKGVQDNVQAAFKPADWEALGSEVQDAVRASVAGNVQSVLQAFGGEINPQNVDAYIAIAPEQAKAAGDRASRDSGSATAGQQVYLQELERSRNLLRDADEYDQFSPETQRKIREIDLLIREATRDLVNARIGDIQRLTGYRQSMLADDDVSGRLALAASSLQSQKGLANQGVVGSFRFNPLLGQVGFDAGAVDTALQTAASAAENQRAIEANALAVQQGQNSASVNPASSIGQAGVEVRNANLALTAATEGEASFWQARASLNAAQFAYSQAVVQGINANALANVDPRDTTGRLQQQLANARRELSLYPAGDPQAGALRDQINQLNVQMQEAAVNQANAAASADVAGRTSGLQQATVSIANAQRTLSIQLPGTEGFYNALAGLRSAQAQLAEQERLQADRIRRLGSDLTDPVAQARLDTQQALETYWANMQAGEGEDVLAQSQLDIRGAQNREEAAMFNQRLSDTQVAEDLGRISHSQYMSYLQSEHDRLNAVGQRTRQQQDQLNQIDQLMKSAAEELQGQFNIGDIDLPTAYDMRRAIGTGAATSVADYSNSNNVVNLNGVDFAQVVEYLQNMLGQGAQVVRAGTRRV